MSPTQRKTLALVFSITLVIALAAMPDRWVNQPADWLIDQHARLSPDTAHRQFRDTPPDACPELKSLTEPVEIQLAYKFPENNGIALVLRDLGGRTFDLYLKSPNPADKSALWQIHLGTIQTNKNNGRAVAPSSPEEKALLGLLQRWYSRQPASRLARRLANDMNTIEIINRLEARHAS